MSSTLLCAMLFVSAGSGTAGEISAGDYESIQAALDANPGRSVTVPPGDHPITRKLRLKGERAGLCGQGRIIQQTATEPIVELEGCHSAEIRDVTLTRDEAHQETETEAILAIRCRDLVIDNVRIIDNRTRSAAIALRSCRNARISHCLIRNYMRVTIDDRTQSPDWGLAFRCTDGTGISVRESTGTLIESNVIAEENLIPTPELKKQHRLGDFSKKNPQKGAIVNQKVWDAEYIDSWQQGSAILATSPETTDMTRILGNQITNAAQGIDLHSDHVIVSNNIVANSFMGMKAMHGSRNVLIIGNQFTKNSIWAIGLMPGVSSHETNTDGGSIIANNIISDFGAGDASWIWGNDRSPLRFDSGQHPDDPPLTDVVIQGNVVQSIGTPRYKYAVIIDAESNPTSPRGLRFSNNLFPSGSTGVFNREPK